MPKISINLSELDIKKIKSIDSSWKIESDPDFFYYLIGIIRNGVYNNEPEKTIQEVKLSAKERVMDWRAFYMSRHPSILARYEKLKDEIEQQKRIESKKRKRKVV